MCGAIKQPASNVLIWICTSFLYCVSCFVASPVIRKSDCDQSGPGSILYKCCRMILWAKVRQLHLDPSEGAYAITEHRTSGWSRHWYCCLVSILFWNIYFKIFFENRWKLSTTWKLLEIYCIFINFWEKLPINFHVSFILIFFFCIALSWYLMKSLECKKKCWLDAKIESKKIF